MLQRFMGEVVRLPGAIEDALVFHTRVTEAIAARDIDRAFAEKIGADGYGANAAEAVELARRLMEKKG